MKPTTYVGRVAGVRVSAVEGSGRVDLTLTAEQVRLDPDESLALLQVIRRAHIRANRKEP